MQLLQKLSKSGDLFEYLELLPSESLLSLYSHKKYGFYICRAVLQSAMPEIARQYILRLAVSGGEFPREQIKLWHSSIGLSDTSESVD